MPEERVPYTFTIVGSISTPPQEWINTQLLFQRIQNRHLVTPRYARHLDGPNDMIQVSAHTALWFATMMWLVSPFAKGFLEEAGKDVWRALWKRLHEEHPSDDYDPGALDELTHDFARKLETETHLVLSLDDAEARKFDERTLGVELERGDAREVQVSIALLALIGPDILRVLEEIRAEPDVQSVSRDASNGDGSGQLAVLHDEGRASFQFFVAFKERGRPMERVRLEYDAAGHRTGYIRKLASEPMIRLKPDGLGG